MRGLGSGVRGGCRFAGFFFKLVGFSFVVFECSGLFLKRFFFSYCSF